MGGATIIMRMIKLIMMIIKYCWRCFVWWDMGVGGATIIMRMIKLITMIIKYCWRCFVWWSMGVGGATIGKLHPLSPPSSGLGDNEETHFYG